MRFVYFLGTYLPPKSVLIQFSVYTPHESCALLGNVCTTQKCLILIFTILQPWELCTFREHMYHPKVFNWARERAERAKRPSILSVIRANLWPSPPHHSCVLLGNKIPAKKGATSIFTTYTPWELCTFRERMYRSKMCYFNIHYIYPMWVVYF